MNVHGRLFQARMWREYAAQWLLPPGNPQREWVEHVGRVSRQACLDRARANLYVAYRLNKGSGEGLDICEGCNRAIDPELCHCGINFDQHSMWDGHSPVPYGCACGYDKGNSDDGST